MVRRSMLIALAGMAIAGGVPAQAKGPGQPVLDLAAGLGATWAVSGFDVVRIDGATGRITTRTTLGPAQPVAVATGEGAVWVLGAYAGRHRRFAAVWRLDPRDGRRVGAAIGMDAQPVGLAVGGGAIWVLDRAAGRLLAFSSHSRRLVREIAVGRAPVAAAIGAGAMWVVRAGLRDRPVRPGSVPCTLLRIDLRTGALRERRVAAGCLRDGLAATDRAAWVAGGAGLLTRVGAIDLERRSERIGAPIAGLAARGDTLWIAGVDGRIETRPSARRLALRTPMPLLDGLPLAVRRASTVSLAADARGLWAASRVGGPLIQAGFASGRIRAAIDLGEASRPARP